MYVLPGAAQATAEYSSCIRVCEKILLGGVQGHQTPLQEIYSTGGAGNVAHYTTLSYTQTQMETTH